MWQFFGNVCHKHLMLPGIFFFSLILLVSKIPLPSAINFDFVITCLFPLPSQFSNTDASKVAVFSQITRIGKWYWVFILFYESKIEMAVIWQKSNSITRLQASQKLTCALLTSSIKGGDYQIKPTWNGFRLLETTVVDILKISHAVLFMKHYLDDFILLNIFMIWRMT